MFAGAAVFVIDFLLLVDLDPFPPGRPNLLIGTAAALAQVPLALVAFILAMVLILKGRGTRPQLAAGGLLLAMVALVILTATYPAALAALGVRTPQPRDILGAVNVAAAAAALGWLALRYRRQWGGRDARLRQILVLLVSLASIRGVYALLHWSAGLGPQFTLLLAGFFLLPPLWTYLVPIVRRRFAARHDQADRPELRQLLGVLDGRENTDSGVADDPGPQPLKTGFVLVSNSLFLYLGTFRAAVSGAVQPDFLHSDLTASAGLLLLGPPVVMLGFVLGFQGWRRHPRKATGQAADRRAWRLVAAIVAAATVFTVTLFAVAFPRSVRASENQPYQADVPGPTCDDGDASWAIPVRPPLGISCTPSALRLTVAARRTSTLSFVPPDGYFAGGYRVSVHVDFGRLASGCLTLETRVTAAGYYWANVCSQGTWVIARSSGRNLTFLSDAPVAPAQAYTVQVTAQGASQRQAIDGHQVAVVADPRYTNTARLVLGVQNLTGQPGQVELSRFAFTPTGTTTRAGTDRVQLTTAAPGCGSASGSWAVMTPVTTRLSCGRGLAALTISPGSLGELAFAADTRFPASYRAAVRVDLADLPGGCAVLGIAMQAQHGYLNEVCASGIWAIDGPGGKVLGHGGLPRGAQAHGSGYLDEAWCVPGTDRPGLAVAMPGEEPATRRGGWRRQARLPGP
jgi:hypothetical protein